MTNSDSSATRYIMSRSGGLMQGIRDSVNAMISDLAGHADDGAKSRTIILIGQDGAELQDVKKGESIRYTGEPEVLANFLRANMARSNRKGVRLRFSGDRAIVKHIRLPSSARDVLPAILRNKVESLAPWPLEESLWGYEISESSSPGEIAVDVGIVSRKSAFATMAALDGSGVKVQNMDIAPPNESRKPITIDFDAGPRENRVRSIVVSAMASLALCAIAVSGFGSYLVFTHAAQDREARAEIADLQQALQGTSIPLAGTNLADANAIYEEKRDAPPLVTIIDALTKAVPDGTWLESIDLRNDKLVITGRGTNTSKVVESLEASSAFAKVAFASAIQRDAERGVDLFTVSAELEKRGVAR
jgi:general secretion pathway protein L